MGQILIRVERNCCLPLTLTVALASRYGNRSALKEVKRSTGECPFDVSTETVDMLTPAGEPVQLLELHVIEAKSLDELGGDFLLDRAAVRQTTDRDILHSGRPLEHPTRTVNAVVVRNPKNSPLASS